MPTVQAPLRVPRAARRLRLALAQLPNDWEALYLGYNRYFSPATDCRAPAARPGAGLRSYMRAAVGPRTSQMAQRALPSPKTTAELSLFIWAP